MGRVGNGASEEIIFTEAEGAVQKLHVEIGGLDTRNIRTKPSTRLPVSSLWRCLLCCHQKNTTLCPNYRCRQSNDDRCLIRIKVNRQICKFVHPQIQINFCLNSPGGP